MDMMAQPILASASMDATIRLWDIANQKQLLAIPYSDSQINALCTTPGVFHTHTLLVGEKYYSVCASASPLILLPSSDGSQLVAAAWQNIRIYSFKEPTANGLHTFGVHEKNVTSVGFQADGRWMYTSGEDCMAKIWDMRVNQLNCQRIFQVNSAVHSVALHPNQSELVVADSAGALYVWDLRNDKDDSLVTELDLNEFITHVDIEARGRQCAAVTNRGNLLVWNLPHTGGLIASIATPPPILKGVSPTTGIGPQGVTQSPALTTGHEGPEEKEAKLRQDALGIALGDSQGQMGGEFPPLAPAPPPMHDSIALLHPVPQGSPLQMPQEQMPTPPPPTPATPATSSANRHGGRPSVKFKAHNTFALRCRFRPDGLAIATTSADQTTKLWGSAEQSKMLGSYGAPDNKWVWDCAFTNDSSHMVTATSDGVLRMWELASNRIVRAYQGHTKGITAMAFRDCA